MDLEKNKKEFDTYCELCDLVWCIDEVENSGKCPYCGTPLIRPKSLLWKIVNFIW